MAQRDQLVVTVARSDEGEADVVPSESVDNLISHLQDELDSILWPHHTEIGGHVGFGRA